MSVAGFLGKRRKISGWWMTFYLLVTSALQNYWILYDVMELQTMFIVRMKIKIYVEIHIVHITRFY